MNKQILFNKYMVGEVARERSLKGFIAYRLYGPKVAYTLVRNQKNPHMLFVLNSKNKVCRLGGYEWFSDKDGSIKPIR